ncbi:MAG TPA: CdaR family protein [Anaerolineaceae bacterium]|jgi:YbbR domain-containing protein
MLSFLRRVLSNLPTFLFALVLAIAVWVISITQANPTSQATYPRPVSIEVIGQDPTTVITDITPKTVSVTINAPQTSWNTLNSTDNLVTAQVILSGLGPGKHNVTVQANVQDQAHPAEVISVTPQIVTVTLEKLATQNFPVHLVTNGEPAIGFQAGTSSLSTATVSVAGPASVVSRVKEVRATIDETQSHENIDSTVTLQPLDSGGSVVSGVTLNPDRIEIQLPITQRYGFRTVSVKVVVTGQVASGYRVTNISVFPLAVTVSSTDPQLVNDLPGFVETVPVSLDGIKNALDVQVPLNLPSGVRVEGDQTVLVQVGIAAIESNLTLRSLNVQAVNVPPGLAAQFSPETVDIILSGPLPILDTLSPSDITVSVDLTGKGIGTFQATPTVQLRQTELRVVSIQPGTVEVSLGPAPSPTPTRRP